MKAQIVVYAIDNALKQRVILSERSKSKDPFPSKRTEKDEFFDFAAYRRLRSE